MEYELLLPVLAVFMLIFDLFQLSRSKGKRNLNFGFYTAGIAFIFMAAAYGLLVTYFASDNFAVAEVYSYSSSSLPLISKICASWAGAGGSVLFLAFMIVTVYFGYRFTTRKKPSATWVSASQILCVLTIFFILLEIGKTPFNRLDVVPLDGAGLNPALQSVWMNVHPPVVFVGYAFVLLAFALGLGGMKSRELAEDRLLNVSAALAWLLMTVGIAMGGVWAYEVLGWGGYWSWDPVETGSLLVWLALTAYFFVRPLAQNGGTLAKQFTMLVAFLALVFLSALTRGGLLRSVHAYALSPAGPILIGFAVGAAVYFFYLQRRIAKPILRLNIDKASVRSVSVAAGFFALAALFFGSFLGVAVPILEQIFTSDPLSPGSAFYNSWSFPFATLLVVAIIGYAVGNKISLKALAAVAVASVVAGSVLAAAGLPTSDSLANVGVPLLVLGLLFVSCDLAKTVVEKRRTWGSFGRRLLFFGMMIGLVGILFSASMRQTASVSSVQFNTSGVATTQVLDVSMVLRNWVVYTGEGQVYSSNMDILAPEHASLKVDVELYQAGAVYRDQMWAALYTNYGTVARPLVVHTLQGDVYMHMDVTNAMYDSLLQGLMGVGSNTPQEVNLTISVVPLVYLLWAGVVLMCLGISLIMAANVRNEAAKEGDDPF